MAVKYTIPYRSIDDTQWRVDILHDAWTDDPIAVRGFGDNACTIEYDGGTDDPFDNPVVSSKANIQLINQGEVDMDELQFAGDRDFVVEVYRDGLLRWKGYLITDNIQQPYLSTPYVVQLSAIDGLNMLEGIEFSIANLPAPSGGAIRCPLNWLRLCLFRTQNLGLPLPIRWVIDLESVETEDDPIAGQITWSPYGDGIIAGTYIDELGNTQFIYQNCRYIVEGIVKAFGCRIFQADGAWWVVRSNDILPQEITYKECEATLSVPTITTHSVDIGRTVAPNGEQIGDYRFIKEDALITVKPALGMVDVEYDADIRENVLPNGGFDQSSLAIPLYWGYSDNPESAATMELYDSLRQDNYGDSVLLAYPVTGAPAPDNRAIFSFNGGLPVDAHLLFKEFNWGFTFMPLNGFPYYLEGENEGTIDWSDNPLRLRMYYESYGPDGDMHRMFLNEYGYWQWDPSEGYLYTDGFTNPSSGTFVFSFKGFPVKSNSIYLKIPSDLGMTFENSEAVTLADQGDLTAVINRIKTKLDAFDWDSVPVTTTVNTISTYEVELEISNLPIVNPANTRVYVSSGKDTILPGGWLPVSVEKMSANDIAGIVFQGRGGTNEVPFPDPGPLNWTTVEQTPETGVLYLEFAVLEGQRYALDDVWMRFADNNDVYRVTSPVTGNDTTQRITMGISSSFSGFMVSNMMRSYHQSNRDFVWTDGTTEASLTEHYARQVMRWRYKPSRIFNGTINTRTKDWSFIHLYLIYGFESVFLPLKARYNTEICEVDLVAMEGRDDGVITGVKHYASNNMPLSNFGGN